MRARINLVTMTDVQEFVNAVMTVEDDVTLIDSEQHCVSAKSLLGALYTMEWKEIYCVCSKDITSLIRQWTV